VSSLADKLSQLRLRASDIRQHLSALGERRRSYSLQASDGDSAAVKVIGDCDFEIDNLRREDATVRDAIEVGEALEKQRALENEQKKEQARQVDAWQHAQAIIALNEEIDLALTQVVQKFERRASLLAGLAGTEVCDATFVARLSGKAGPTRACCRVGLHKYVDIVACAPGSMASLADLKELLCNVGKPPDDGKVNNKTPRPLRENNKAVS
jgi:hypothetical protein